MTKAEFQVLEPLFHQAVAITNAAEREGYIATCCPPALIEALHQWIDADTLQAGTTAESTHTLPRCGPYQAEAALGIGGSGLVYRARRADGEFEHVVALKLLRAAARSDWARARFRAERRILAQLRHPNIATLHDGGVTADGEPYLVMEFIDGEPINEYCDRRRLSIGERLRIFGQVLAAVDYAHQNLVLHGDLKPANILVTAEGTVKLVDFGTSRFLDEDAGLLTQATMTPKYASPEQLRGERLTMASEVYTLGLNLFELLAGVLPFRSAAPPIEVIERGVREPTPLPLDSALSDKAAELRGAEVEHVRKQLRGDLSRIAAKALCQDPAGRYALVSELAADLVRFERGLPVLASPLTRWYRVQKFVARNRVAIGIGALVAGAVLSAGVYSLLQQRHAAVEARRSRDVNEFLTHVIDLTSPTFGGHARMTMLDWLSMVDQYSRGQVTADPATMSDIQSALARAFFAQQQYAQFAAYAERALASARQAADIPREALCTLSAATAHYVTGQPARAIAETDRAVKLFEQHRRAFDPPQTLQLLFLAGSTYHELKPNGSPHVALLTQAVALAESGKVTLPDIQRASLYGEFAESLVAARDYQHAEAEIEKAIAIERRQPLLQTVLAFHLSTLARVQRFLGRYDLDERYQRESFEQTRARWGPNSPETALMQARWAFALTETANFPEAANQAAEALRIVRAIKMGEWERWTELDVASYTQSLVGNYKNAEALAREAIASLGPAANSHDGRYQESRGMLGLALAGEGRNDEARLFLSPVLSFYEGKGNSPLVNRLREAYRRTLN